MKIILCLFLIQVFFCLGDNEHASTIGDFHYGHNQHESIERPCKLQDLHCIRRYLDHSSQCSAHGPVKSNAAPVDIPFANLSAILYDVDLKGLNHFRIGEFYINKGTNKLVLEVIFHEIRGYSPRVVVNFYRMGYEPVVRADYLLITYRDISLTLTAPLVKGAKTSESHVYSFFNNPVVDIQLGPQFLTSTDYTVKRAVSALVFNLGLTLQEAFVSFGPMLLSSFLQDHICGL